MRYWKLRKQGNGILRARPGISIVESVILLVILGISFGAIFTTAAMAQRVYGESRQRRESRELLFNWVQNFESTWVPNHTLTDAQQGNNAMTAVENVGQIMGATATIGLGTARMSQIGMFNVTVENVGIANGMLNLAITIAIPRGTAPPRNLIAVQRSFNIFSNNTVRDAENDD